MLHVPEPRSERNVDAGASLAEWNPVGEFLSAVLHDVHRHAEDRQLPFLEMGIRGEG